MSFFSKSKITTSLTFLGFFIPAVIFAASATTGNTSIGSVPATPTNLKSLICIIAFLALDFVPYIITLAVVAFITGLIKYVGNGDNEEKRGEGNKLMIYGIVGLFFMVSIWGILKIFTNSFNVGFGVPQFKEQGSSAGCSRTSSSSGWLY